MLQIQSVASKKQKKDFRNLTDKIYQDYPNYVPYLKIDLNFFLNEKKHPFFQHGKAQLFIAYRDGKSVGRICAYQNDRHNHFHKDKVGFFGSFECINDIDVANELLNAAKQWLAQRGFNKMRGPVDYYSNEPQGLLIDGYDSHPPASLAYHPPYYKVLLENFGLQKQADLFAYELPHFNDLPFHRGNKFIDRVTSRNNITLRPLNMRNLKQDTEYAVELFNIFEQANGQNFIPITFDEAHHFIKTIKQIIDPELVFFAEKEGKAIGFVATIPDANEVLINVKNGRLLPTGIFKLLKLKSYPYKRLRILLLGMRDEFRKTGLGPAMCQKALLHAKTKNFKSVDMSMIHEDNTLMINTCERLGANIYKRYRVYEMDI